MPDEMMTPEEVAAEIESLKVKAPFGRQYAALCALKAAVEATQQTKTFNSMDGCNAWSQACREVLDAICREMSK